MAAAVFDLRTAAIGAELGLVAEIEGDSFEAVSVAVADVAGSGPVFATPDVSHERNVLRPLGGGDEDIFLEQGILPSSSCTDPNGVETELLEWIRTRTEAGPGFLRHRRNLGAYSLYAAKHHRGAVKVYAFEPAAPTIPVLIHNIVRNRCEATVVPMTFPLAGKPTLAMFNYHTKLSPGQSRHTFGDAVDFEGKAFQPVFQEGLVSTTLDQLVGEYHLPPPTTSKSTSTVWSSTFSAAAPNCSAAERSSRCFSKSAGDSTWA